MSTPALVMMISVQSIVVVITAYFFVKVLRTPPKQEPDSYTEE